MNEDPLAMTVAMQILLLAGLTLVNAFFAGAEMAVVSVNKNKVKRLAEEGNKRAALIQKLSEDSTSFLSTIQVAITFAGFFSSASAATGISQILAAEMAKLQIPYSESLAIVLVTILLSYVTLVFGELVPKRIALQKSEQFSLFAVTPIYLISKVMAPFIKLLSLSTNGILRLLGMNHAKIEEEVSKEEIKAMLETGSEAGVFNEIEKEMITSIFSFDDKKAKEVMVPRQDIIALDLEECGPDSMDEVLQSMHSKIPVYQQGIDHIVGILSMKDYMIVARNASFKQEDVKNMMQDPFFVPENRRIDELFREMQSSRKRMAILIDEYGGVSGLVTMEDLVEEIVGDMHDEYEVAEPELLQINSQSYQVSGRMQLKDLNERLHLKLSSDYDTVSGFLIEQLGYIPCEKDLPIRVKHHSTKFEIIQMEAKVIERIIIEL